MIIGKGGIESGSKVFGAGGADNGTRIFGEGGDISGSYVFNKDILTATNIATLSGTQYGTIDTAVTFGAGEDFRVDVEMASTDTTSISIGVFGYGVAGTTNYLRPIVSGGTANFQTVNGNVTWTHGNEHLDGKTRTLSAFRTGLDTGIELNGVEKARATQGAASQIDIDLVGCLGVAGAPDQFFKGQILSIKFTNITTGVIRNFVFDSGSIVEQYARGSTTDKITLLNFALADWSRYTLQRNITHDAGTVALAWVGENVVVNGRFDADLSGWTVSNPSAQTVEWVNGELHIAGDGVSSYGVQQDSIITNNVYLVKADYRAISGVLKIQVGSTGFDYNTTGAKTILHQAEVGTLFLYRRSGTSGEGYFDNVSAQHLLEVV